MLVLNAIAGVKKKGGRTKVLEIGFGRGYCTLMLAGLLLPSDEFEFHGMDIVQRHVDVARADGAKYPNVFFRHADAALASSYDDLQQFDVIFAVEALCHIERMHDFLANAGRRLSQEGRLVIIDGFRSELFSQSPPDQQLAMRLAERAFGINRMRPMSEWVEAAFPAGLELNTQDDLTMQALPFWTLGWRFVYALLRHVPGWVMRHCHGTNNLLAVATVAHAMRNRASAVYGVMVFCRRNDNGAAVVVGERF